jgi:hypothetical protein
MGKLHESGDAKPCDLAAKQQACIGLMNLQHFGNLGLGQLPRLDLSPDRNPEIVPENPKSASTLPVVMWPGLFVSFAFGIDLLFLKALPNFR